MALKLGNFCAGHPPKVVLGVLPGPFNSIGVDLQLLLRFLIDVHFLEGVFMQYSKMVVPQFVQSTIGTPAIAVYGGPCFYVSLNDWYEGVLRPVRDGIYEEGISFPLHHSKNPYLRKKFRFQNFCTKLVLDIRLFIKIKLF